jgi:hypothetical protein
VSVILGWNTYVLRHAYHWNTVLGAVPCRFRRYKSWPANDVVLLQGSAYRVVVKCVFLHGINDSRFSIQKQKENKKNESVTAFLQQMKMDDVCMGSNCRVVYKIRTAPTG